MLSLYKLLMLEIENDDEKTVELKKSISSMIYMDNGGFSCNNLETLQWSFEEMQKILSSTNLLDNNLPQMAVNYK